MNNLYCLKLFQSYYSSILTRAVAWWSVRVAAQFQSYYSSILTIELTVEQLAELLFQSYYSSILTLNTKFIIAYQIPYFNPTIVRF